jgi:1-acyl-sn-glycerol-3-phosphate acyltransferase
VWLVVALQVTFRPVFRLLFRMRVEGQAGVPTTGGVIVAGNHSGFLDGPLVWLYSPRPVRFLTKAELYRQPLLARALGWLGQIPVHRGEPDRAALGEALAVLAEGGAVGVFPEGRRSDGALSEVHDGVAYLAVKSGCPVVPVACLGSGRALPRGGRRVRLRTPITVAYGSATTLVPGGGLRSRRTVAAAGAEIRGALLGHLTAVARRSGQPLPHAEEETR